MSRLIDADELRDEIDEWLDSVGVATVGKGLSYYAELLGCIEETPTIDAEPVRHGRWIGKPIAGYGTVRCSVCKNILCENTGKFKYCPWCGAKMDEV